MAKKNVKKRSGEDFSKKDKAALKKAADELKKDIIIFKKKRESLDAETKKYVRLSLKGLI